MVDFRPLAWLFDLRSSNYVDDVAGLIWSRAFAPFDAAVELRSTPTGVATVTATLSTIKEIEGSSDGVSSVTGLLTAETAVDLAATPTGSGSVNSSSLFVASQLLGATSGAATVSGDLSQIHELAATSDGIGRPWGDLRDGTPDLAFSWLLTTEMLASIDIGQGFTFGGEAFYPTGPFSTGQFTRQLSGTIDGSAASVIGEFNFDLTEFPIPYLLGYGGPGVDELTGSSNGRSQVTGSAPVIKDLAGASDGVGTMFSGVIGSPVVLSHRWPLDETSGTVAVDTDGASSEDMEYVNTNSTYLSVDGISNTALDTGNNRYVRATGTNFYETDEFSYTMWFYNDWTNSQGDAVQFLFDTANNFADDSVFAYWDTPPDNLLVFHVNQNSPTADMILTYDMSSLTANTWHHVVFTYSKSAGEAFMYVNGIEVASDTFSTAANVAWNSPALYWGAQRKGAGDRWWSGRIDELGWDNTALSLSQVGTLFTEFSGGFEVIDWEGLIDGVATVSGTLQQGLDDGDGDIIVELGTALNPNFINGTSSVTGWRYLLKDKPRPVETFLHWYMNVGFGFGDIDDVSDRSDFVDQWYPDGHTEVSFDRFLHWYMNIGFGFRDVDDVSDHPDFVEQWYPDGDTEVSFSRWLHMYLNVILGIGSQNDRLIVRPGRNDQMPPIPPSDPPHNVPS